MKPMTMNGLHFITPSKPPPLTCSTKAVKLRMRILSEVVPVFGGAWLKSLVLFVEAAWRRVLRLKNGLFDNEKQNCAYKKKIHNVAGLFYK
jgi:hypothetical protein